MTESRTRPSGNLLIVILVLFLAGVAWWWSMRAIRVDASTAPTPTITPPGQTATPTRR